MWCRTFKNFIPPRIFNVYYTFVYTSSQVNKVALSEASRLEMRLIMQTHDYYVFYTKFYLLRLLTPFLSPYLSPPFFNILVSSEFNYTNRS